MKMIETGNFQVFLSCRRDDESGIPENIVNPTYTVEYNYGSYQRVDDICFITFHIKANITNGGIGYASILGLPYKSADSCGGQALAMQEMFCGASTIGNLTCTIKDNTKQINLQQNNGLSAFYWGLGTIWIGFSGSYFIDENAPSGWIDPIYNRTQADIDKLELYKSIGYRNLSEQQKTEYLAGMIGALNYKDLNRIENDLELLSRLLNIPYINKTDWNMLDIFGGEESDRIINQLKNMVLCFDSTGWPQVPDRPLNYYVKINTIESLLMLMYQSWIGTSIYTFLTNNGDRFLTNNGENFIVSDGATRVELITSNHELILTTTGYLNVFEKPI